MTGLRRLLSESFLPLLVILLAILGVAAWIDSYATSYARREQVIQVTPTAAGWDPELLGDDGMREREEGAALDPAANRPEIAEARRLSRASDHRKALAILTKALATAPKDAALWNEAGVYRLRAGEARAAVEAFDKALALDAHYERALFNRAVARAKSGDRAGARADYLAVIAQHPRYFEAVFNLGLLLLDEGDAKGATDRLRAAVDLAGNDARARALFSLGVALGRQGRRDEALAAYEKSIEFAPSYLLPRYNQAALYASRKEDRESAEQLVSQIVALAPDFAPAWFLRGRLASMAGDTGAALKHYEKASRLDRRFFKAQYNYALLSLKVGKVEQAEPLFERLAADFPERAEPLFNLGRLAYRKKRFEAALASYQKALELRKGDYPEARLNLGLTLDAMGRRDEALAAFDAVPRGDPTWAAALLNRGLVLKHQKRFEEARGSLRDAVAADAGNAKALYNLAKLEAELGSHEKAEAAYRDVLAKHPKHLKAAVNLGVERAALRRYDGAIEAYRQALAISPSYIPAHFNLGVALREAGKLEEAAAAYRRVIELDEENVKAYQNLGVVYSRLGQIDLAVRTFESALDLDAGNADVRYNLALQLQKLGNTDAAEAELERVLKLATRHPKATARLALLRLERGDADAVVPTDEESLRALVDLALAQGEAALVRPAVADALTKSPTSASLLKLSNRLNATPKGTAP